MAFYQTDRGDPFIVQSQRNPQHFHNIPLGHPQHSYSRQNSFVSEHNDDMLYDNNDTFRNNNGNSPGGHTSVQINAMGALNQTRRSLPILALIYFLWNIVEIVVISTILGLTWHQRCDEPTIRIICIARVIRNGFVLPVHFRRIIGIPETDFDFRIQGISRLSLMFFFIFSQQWLSDGEQCRKEAPILYWTGIGVIILLYLTILAPIILVLLICLCLPCVLIVFRWLNVGDLPTAASNSDVEQIPEFQFDPDTYTDPFTGEHITQEEAQQRQQQQQQQPTSSPLQPAQQPTYPTSPSHIPKSPSLSAQRPTAPSQIALERQPTTIRSPRSPRTVPTTTTTTGAPSQPPPPPPSKPTPECPICLCEFEKGENLKQLKCSHLFHGECIKGWLQLNRTCPVCRADAITGAHQDVATRSTLNHFF